MKLVVIGGGGVRSPYLAKSIVSNAEKAKITKVVFLDTDAEKIRIFGGLSKVIAEKINSAVDFSYTTDKKAALKGADFIITTLRVGGDESRVFDERTALNLGILGQETTGAGGFAMAMRSIPVLLEYCELIKKIASKGALIFNFTNPSGMVTQALRSAGYGNVYGICDAPSELIKQLIRMVGTTEKEFSIRCFGLNHLSWFKEVKVGGVEVTGELIANDDLFADTDMRVFDRELVAASGNVLMNEYLQYYYYREEKIKKIRESQQTRGELIEGVNRKMFEELRSVDVFNDFERAFAIYLENFMIRENSYGMIETGRVRIDTMEKVTFEEFLAEPDGGGYAGVALDFIKSYMGGEACEMVLSVSNDGAIPGVADDDVVEVSCRIEEGKVNPLAVEDIDEMPMVLIRTMKFYERMAVDAITTTSRRKALRALTVHPLINSYTLAAQILEKLINRYEQYTGGWH